MIKEERRTPPREQAIVQNADIVVQTGTGKDGMPTYSVTKRPPQLHMSNATAVTDTDNLLYASEWDGRSPWITVLLGSIGDLKLSPMGWPMVTEAEWTAQQAAWQAANPEPVQGE